MESNIYSKKMYCSTVFRKECNTNVGIAKHLHMHIFKETALSNQNTNDPIYNVSVEMRVYKTKHREEAGYLVLL